jgi:hypothetical protein
VIFLSEVQPPKTPSPIQVTELGIAILSSEVQFEKAFHPISVTELGIVILSSEVQPSKALSSIFFTESGIIVVLQPATIVFVAVSMMALQPSRESYTELPFATTILSSEVQPEKNLGAFLVTNLGIVILLSEVQLPKAYSLIIFNDSGKTIDSNALQSLNAPSPISVTGSGIVTLLSAVQPLKV